MNPVEKYLADTKFADLDGARLSGRLALSDELVNLGLQDVLQKVLPGKNTLPARKGPPSPSVEAVAEKPIPPLRVEKLKYSTQTGKTILDLDVRLAAE